MKSLALAFLLPLLLLSCKKDAPSLTLPPATMEGKNTAGFLLDGKVWVPFAKCQYLGDPCKEIATHYGLPYTNEDYIAFSLGRITKDSYSALNIDGQVPITKPGDYSKDVIIHYIDEVTYTYHGSPEATGRFIVTKVDHDNQIISGTFSCTLKVFNGSGKSIEITDGRFDFQMNACICR